MNKFLRELVLNKIAAVYEDKNHKSRIRKRRDVMQGEEEDEFSPPRDKSNDEALIEEFLKKKEREQRENLRKSEKDPRHAITPDHIEEIASPYSEALRQRGISPERESLSFSEVERRRKVEEELGLYSTIGEVEGLEGSTRHYVDPNHPQGSPLHRYFGYYDKERGEWHPTQYSYIMFFLAAYAPELGLTDFWDRSSGISLSHNSFRKHPYRRRYADRMRGEFFPFERSMEDRLFTDFPKIIQAIKDNVHDLDIRTNEGLPYISPRPPEADRRFSGGVEVRFDPSDETFMIRGPRTKPVRFQSSYVPEQSDASRITSKILSKTALYPKLESAINALKSDINDNILREILSQNKELNFQRTSPEKKEMIRGAIITAVNEILEAEVIRIIEESEF